MQDYYIYRSVFLVFMFLTGSAVGSFLCCQARRLRLKQKGTKVSKSADNLGPRSVCLHCHYQLKWYDNLPIISWLLLRGKCRKCHKKIGLAEFLSELGLGLAFLLTSYGFDLEAITIYSAIMFFVTIALIVSLGFLAIYDGLYGELPNFCLFSSIFFALVLLIVRQCEYYSIIPFSTQTLFDNLLQVFLSVLALSGTYLVLYLISRGKWVGDGDWLLALALALALASPWLSLITLFLANLLACLVMLPVLKHNSKKTKTARIHLGPFLILAFFIIFSFSDFFLSMI